MTIKIEKSNIPLKNLHLKEKSKGMGFTRLFTVPDYYKDFFCKGTSCRRTCCKGWKVTLSFKEYFKLIGLNCTKALRKKLDVAFLIKDRPSAESYAEINHNFDELCPILCSDGLCFLHKECGEKALPAVCRYYPRAAHLKYANECSCTGSCERVLEMLFEKKDKLTFEEKQLSFDYDEPKIKTDTVKSQYYRALRNISFCILQNRDRKLNERLYVLGLFLEEADKTSIGIFVENSNLIKDKYNNIQIESDVFLGIPSVLDMQRKIADFYEENSLSLEEYREEIENHFDYRDNENVYNKAKEEFTNNFPDWEVKFENVLINHLFYEQFPFEDGNIKIFEAYRALCAVYAFLRYVAVMYTLNKKTLFDLIDIIGAALRVVEHSSFYKDVSLLLKNEDFTTLDNIKSFLTV